jgi:outer membrane protein assembly factor BamB
MRKSLPIAVMMVAALLVTTGCKNKPPKTPARPSGPTLVVVSTSVTYTSVTTDPNKDKIRYEFDWKDGSLDTTGYITSGDTASKAHIWADTGLYAIRVRAEDDKSHWAPDPSDSLLVHVVLDTLANTPPGAPAKPTVTGPLWVDSLLTVTTSATDPDGDSVAIAFYYSDGSSPTWSAYVANGATVTGNVTYSTRGTKVVQARAMDKRGDTSDLSPAETIYINVVNTAPVKPTISAMPRRGIASGPAYRFYAQTIDPQGDSLKYRFYFGAADSATGNLVPNGIIGMASWQPNLPVGSYVVRAAAIDQFGLMSPLSDPDTFDVVGEGSIIWVVADDFIASPAIGTARSHGANYPAIVVGSRDANLYAVDAYLGEVANEAILPDADEFQASAAIGADGSVYAPNEDGALYAYNPDGSAKWRYTGADSGQGLSATPALDGSAIYFGGEGRLLHKVTDNGSSYTDNWAFPLTNELIGSPAIAPDGSIIAVDDSGYVYSVSAAGSQNWKVASGESVGVTSSPAVAADGSIYIGTEGGKFICIRSGAVQWTYVTNPRVSISCSPAIGANGTVYFAADDGMLYQIDAQGSMVGGWPVQVSPYPISSSPLLCSNGAIYILDDDEKLHCRGANGDSLWTLPLLLPPAKRHGGSRPRPLSIDVQPSPVVDQYGIIYITTSDAIYAVAGSTSRVIASSDWPMFHHDVRHTGKYGARRR